MSTFKPRPPFTIFHAVQRAFRTEDAARAFFTDLRWQKGKFCPYCGHRKIYSLQNGKTHKCADCRKSFTITVGTIFEGSKLPLQTWMFAIACLCDSGGQIGSTKLAAGLGLSQKSAWYMLKKLREASLTLSFRKPLQGRKPPHSTRNAFGPSLEDLEEKKQAKLPKKPTKPQASRAGWLVYSGNKAEMDAVEIVLNKLHAARRLGDGMGPGDAARYEMLLTPLVTSGYRINSGACYRWACDHGWEEDAASELEEVIQGLMARHSSHA